MLETKVIFMDLLSKFDLSMNPMYKARISLKFLPEPVDPIMLRLSKKRSYSWKRWSFSKFMINIRLYANN